MVTRAMGYEDYGFKPGEEKLLLTFCMRQDFGYDLLLLQCAWKANPAIAADLYYSIRKGLSSERLETKAYQIYSKTDFYAYRRMTLALFRKTLIHQGCYPPMR